MAWASGSLALESFTRYSRAWPVLGWRGVGVAALRERKHLLAWLRSLKGMDDISVSP